MSSAAEGAVRAVPPEVLEAVRRGLAEGLSWSQIGRRVGKTKNAISGIVRRHIYGPANNFRNPARQDIPRKEYSRKKQPRPRAPIVAPIRLPPPPPPVPVFVCQWPLNDGRPWRFCQEQAVFGRPYCAAHCRRAYHLRPAA